MSTEATLRAYNQDRVCADCGTPVYYDNGDCTYYCSCPGVRGWKWNTIPSEATAQRDRIVALELALTWVMNRNGAMTSGLVAKHALGHPLGRGEKCGLLRAVKYEETAYLPKPWIRDMVDVDALERELSEEKS